MKVADTTTLPKRIANTFLKESGGKTTCIIGLWRHWPVWHPWWMQECTVF